MKQLRIEDSEALAAQKNAAWKVGVAAFMKVKLLASNRWVGERLGMGVPTAVSRYTGEVLRGALPAARRIYERLNATVKV